MQRWSAGRPRTLRSLAAALLLRHWTLERDSPWVALGLLVTVAAALRVVATPGEMVQGDLGSPFAIEFWTRMYTNAWDTSYGSALVSVQRTYTYMPWGLVIQALELSPEAAGKFHWLSWHLLGFLAGYVGARFLVGPEIRAAHPVAVRIGLMLAGLFWALNPWTLARWEQLGVHVSSVMLPLVIGLVVSATCAHNSRARTTRALAAAATLAFTVSTSPHYMAIGLLLALGWFVYAAVTARGARRPIAVTALIFMSGYAVFAAFILVPFVIAVVAGSPTAPRYALGTDVQPVLESRQSIINTLTLTGHGFFGPGLRPAPDALPGWRMAALLPAALLALAIWRQPRQRRVLGYAVIVGCAAALIQIASYAEETRSTYLAFVTNAPFGWALREPDKISGALALAYLPGIALAPATFARDAPRGLPAAGTIQTAALGLVLTAFMLPGINRMLWNDHELSLVPERFPDSFHSVPAEIDRRNAAGASRTLLAMWPLRFPEWSSNRVLDLIESLAVTTPYAARNSVAGARLVALIESDSTDVADVLRAHGVARVLVATGTPRGQAVAQRLRQTKDLEPELTADYYEVLRTVDPVHPWVYEDGRAGPVELAWKREGMHRLVVDIPPAGRQTRELFTQELWDPLWTAALPNHAAIVEPSEQGLLLVRVGPGSSGRLVLEFGLQRALIAGHAIAWAGLFAWIMWMLWPYWPRPGRARR